jgi:DeoR family suf operon transcriptional repressor
MTTTQQQTTKQDILYFLLKQGQASAQALAEQLAISPQAIRRHLKDLEQEELIEHQSIQSGMGRPNHVYQLSRKGRDRLPAQYDDFALSLLDTLAETVGREQVKDILRKQWERKALDYRQKMGNGALQERVARLVELRQEEGYMAEWHEVEPENDEIPGSRFIITEYNCAISQIATAMLPVYQPVGAFYLAILESHLEHIQFMATNSRE